MENGINQRVEYGERVLGLVAGEGFLRGIFSGVRRWGKGGGGEELSRVVVRVVEMKGGRFLQVSRFLGKKDVSRNYSLAEIGEGLRDVLGMGFSNVHVTTVEEEIDLRLTKKGEVREGRQRRRGNSEFGIQNSELVEGHNRVKHLPLPEGRVDRVLEVMGIMTAGGVVRAGMRGKFVQINEFLKLLEPVLVRGGLEACALTGGLGGLEDSGSVSKPSGQLPATQASKSSRRVLEILDCGCGLSYLTIAAHHYLNDVKGIAARVVGVDVNEELIRKSAERAEKLGCEGLEFLAGRIGKLEGVRADVVLALHACDTATDDAIAQGVRSGARVIVAVPCCHKELNGRLHVEGMGAVERHGILYQRLADIVTDAFRALVLRVMGYRAEVIEFVSSEHTARNVMIRAVRTGKGGEAGVVREYVEFRERMGAAPYLEGVMGEGFRRMVGEREMTLNVIRTDYSD